MASRRPIVLSDLPALRSILTDKEAKYFKAGDIGGLSSAIREVSENKNLADSLSESAFLKVKNYTWEKRAGDIINFINTRAE